jgi:hypothetical protein
MSKTKLTTNDLTQNYSGIFGNMVQLRNQRGKSIMTIPRRKQKTDPSPAQLNVRKMFTLATRYAKNVLLNPDMFAAYSAKSRGLLTPYILAVTDYLRPPYVSEILTGDYTGKPGSTVHVVADDDFGISGVTVTIRTAGGELVEKGNCTLDLLTGRYDFTAKTTIDDLNGVEVSAVATDFPGHTATHSVTL